MCWLREASVVLSAVSLQALTYNFLKINKIHFVTFSFFGTGKPKIRIQIIVQTSVYTLFLNGLNHFQYAISCMTVSLIPGSV